MKKILALVLCVAMVFSMSACGGGKKSNEVTLKFLSNLTDRTTGQGLVEQQLMDMYAKEHPNVKFELETLGDADLQTKFKSYVTAGTLPDITMVWVIPSYMDQFIDAGIFAEIPQDYIKNAKFSNGALDYAMRDGKCYALGRNTDVMVFYYNKDLFKKYNVEIPKTYEELLEAGDVFNQNGVIPCAMSGAASWCDSHFIVGIQGTLLGDKTITELPRAIKEGDFSGDYWKKSCDLAVEGAKRLFQYGFETYDYGTAQNLFLNGEAAMWWMGSWEMSVNPGFEVGAFAMGLS
ncbi:MAG: extracellular solute-binding protein [Lachnospiraceae bacterium]|nr:extracellular solute-binding protein [Lachnospiraceae bacterium]